MIILKFPRLGNLVLQDKYCVHKFTLNMSQWLLLCFVNFVSPKEFNQACKHVILQTIK